MTEDVEGHLFSDFSGGTVSLQISSGAKLHHQVDVVRSSYDLIKFNDVGMLQLLHDADLVVQRLFEVAVGDDQFLIDFLDGHLPALVTGGLVDLTERALPQAMSLVESVVFDFFDDVHPVQIINNYALTTTANS